MRPLCWAVATELRHRSSPAANRHRPGGPSATEAALDLLGIALSPLRKWHPPDFVPRNRLRPHDQSDRQLWLRLPAGLAFQQKLPAADLASPTIRPQRWAAQQPWQPDRQKWLAARIGRSSPSGPPATAANTKLIVKFSSQCFLPKTGEPASTLGAEAWPAVLHQTELTNLEREATAVIEGLYLRDRNDARTYARDHMGIANNAGTNSAPACGDYVRFADSYRHDKVEAVRRQSAQDQVEVAKRVRRGTGTSPGSAGWIVAGISGGAVGSGGTAAGGDQRARGKLRKQLRANLLESLVINHSRRRQDSRAASIDLHAYSNSDIGRCRRNTRRDLRVGKEAGNQ